MRRRTTRPARSCGNGLDRALLAVEAQVVGALGLPPERVVEPIEQPVGLGAHPLGVLGPIEQLVHVAEPDLRVVGVALELADREWQGSERTVGRRDRVARVLPALVVVAVARPRLVLLEAVAVAIAGLVDPGHRGLDVGEVALDDRDVAEPVVEVRDDDHEEARGVVGAVVGLERQDAQLGELAVADLVGDLAGLHVPLGVVPGRLERREATQRPHGELGEARDALHRDDQRVPAEQGQEPRDAGRGNEDTPFEARVLEAQGLHVERGPVPGAPDRDIRGVDPHPRQGPPRRLGDGIAGQDRWPAV
jgi:hypothetical protein